MDSIKTHSHELKIRCIRILILMCLVSIGIWNYIDSIISYLITQSSLDVMTLYPFEMIQSKMYVCISIAFILSLPYILFEIYRFVSPGLYPNERKVILVSIVPFYAMFLSGIMISIQFFINIIMFFATQFYITGIDQTVALSKYISFIISSSILVGILFCMPNVAGILTYIGLLKNNIMKAYRKHVIIIILLFSAIISPPDVFSLVLMAIPIIVLYEISIITSMIIEKFKIKGSGI